MCVVFPVTIIFHIFLKFYLPTCFSILLPVVFKTIDKQVHVLWQATILLFYLFFQAFLQTTLMRMDRSRALELHRRAGSLWEKRGQLYQAIDHYLQGEAYEEAVRILESELVDLFIRGEWRTVSTWIDALPPEIYESRPLLLIAQATIAQLLEHSSGLPAWRPFFYEVASWPAAWTHGGPAAVRRLAARQRPERPPGQRALYSDVGFILLEWIIERASGQRLDRLFRRLVNRHLPGAGLFFPLTPGQRRRHRFAATELCPWRGRVLCGQVHDDNAYVMGGVSGHAGLFGTSGAVAALAGAWLDAFRGRRSWLPTEMVRRFWQRAPQPGSSRTLGWDKPSGENSQAGRLLGAATVGHTGFTGTSLWLDPERQLVIVLLTNRVHPDRGNQAISRFRPRLHDLIAKVVDR